MKNDNERRIDWLVENEHLWHDKFWNENIHHNLKIAMKKSGLYSDNTPVRFMNLKPIIKRAKRFISDMDY